MTVDSASLVNYPNPLDNFRSYSYHFIMTVSNTSQAFIDQIGGGTNSTSITNSNQPAPLLSAVLQAEKPGAKMQIGQSTVYLVFDTRRFSQYSVTDFDMTHVYGTGNRVNPTTPVATHRMQIIDTTGISFFNLLMDLFRNKVKSSRFSAFFLLAIVFVGHRDDGITETIDTTYIPMIALSMGMHFNASGSTFQMEFIEQEGGQTRGGAGTDQMNYMGDCKSITTQGLPNTIGGMLDALENKLNLQSLDFFQKYSNAVVTKTDAQGNPIKIGKLVQYMITAPNEWRAYSLDTAEASSNTEKMYIATTQDITPSEVIQELNLAKILPGSTFSSMKFSDATTIPDAIKGILESSNKILQLASTNRKNAGQAITFKILVALTSDDTSYIVHYDIYPFYLPQIQIPKQQNQTSTPTTTIVQAGNKNQNLDSSNRYENIITYNYLFSGKNNAIIDLDIKFDPESASQALDTNLNIGTQRFGQIASAGQVKSNIKLVTTGANKSDGLYAPDIRQSDPIFLPIKSKDQKDNNASQKNAEAIAIDQAIANLNAKQQYTQTLASVHFLSNMQIDLTVRGNPNIIAKFADRNTRGGCPPHGQIISPAQVSVLTQSGQGTAQQNFDAILSKSLKTAKSAYYTTYYYPRIANILNPKSSKSLNIDPLRNGPDISVHPVFVLIKIFAPNVDSTGNFITGGPMFTDEFFYNGLYQLMILETKFQGGDFVHNMTLIADLGTSTQNDVPVGAQ